MHPTILYEDPSLLVLNKPAGITVNKSDTTKGEDTIQDWVEEYLKVPEGNQFDTFYQRAGIVHRLDKETSGILLVAKTPEAFVDLQRQFKERLVKKTYLALAHGKITPETGEINVPVGRLPWNRKRFGVVAGGRDSLTRYKVLSYYTLYAKSYTLLELYPETGRTHQIRVHLKHIGHPIFGDSLYAGRKTARDDRKFLERVFLHAAKISFFHPARHRYAQALAGEPVYHELLTFEAPLPDALQKILTKEGDSKN